MPWTVSFHTAFLPEFEAMAKDVQDGLVVKARLLEALVPSLGRPQVDTLSGSKFANMKELRFQAGHGVWRVAFAFDPKRNAIILVAGNRAGVAQQRFYKHLITKADARFSEYLESTKGN